MKHHFAIITAVALALAGCADNDPANDEPQPPGGSALAQVKVLSYTPAPGQFVNILPEYRNGDTAADMAAKAETALNAGQIISLGAFGGEVVMKLVTPIANRDGSDFKVLGNAFVAGKDASGRSYGSAEPGVVWVSADVNNNGRPDDTWYQLKGSESASAVSATVTYTAPADDAPDAQYIKWDIPAADRSGYLQHLPQYHAQPYYPSWVSAGQIVLTGTLLPDNAVYNTATGNYDLFSYSGYADSYPNDSDDAAVDIDAAIDDKGRHAELDKIDFIKVQTGVMQVCGIIGEISTEIAGIKVL